MEDELIKSLPEALKAGTKVLEISEKLGSFLSRVFGDVPEDIVGILGGDYLHHIRMRNVEKLTERTRKILKERGNEEDTTPVSLNIALPLFNAAKDESREELQELWARMLANAMDPNRSSAVRQNIIETVRAFEPIDAKVLETASTLNKPQQHVMVSRLNESLKAPLFELEVSLRNLVGCDCIATTLRGNSKGKGLVETETFTITHLGHEVLRACSP